MVLNMTQIEVSAPSNIAFLKYWGKSDPAAQWPAGNSLSMTLKNAKTVTKAWRTAKDSSDDLTALEDKIFFHGQASQDQKILKAIQLIRELTGLKGAVTIDTFNTFPKSCGIASSASGMAALTIAVVACLTDSTSFWELEKNGFSKIRLSHLARRCSGSAGRSLFGGFVEWQKGETAELQVISQKYTESHWPLANLILIVDDKTKAISSTEAHEAAWSSPFFKPRLAGLWERELAMLEAIKEKDLEKLGPLLEAEALEMHGVIMTATPPASYLTEETLKLISWIRLQRQKGNFRAWFTIDAGPNLHLICEASDQQKIEDSLKKAFPSLNIMRDEVGSGPEIRSLS
jgi:diphosphomevalonate decarboxylase